MRGRNAALPFVTILIVGMLIIGGFLFYTFNGNRSLIDTKFYYDYAIVQLANGDVIEGKVDSWRDYEGDQLQLTINGETWLVHSANVSLRTR